MAKHTAVLLFLLLLIETFSVSTDASQNVFTIDDESNNEIVSPPVEPIPPPPKPKPPKPTPPKPAPPKPAPPKPTPTKTVFTVKTGRSIGTGRGGDRLLKVESTSTLSFFPRDIALSAELIDGMNTHFGKCVSDSAKAAGLGSITSINISHGGGYKDRRVNNGSNNPNRPWSLHASGRALDISRLDLVANGKTYRFPMIKKSHDGSNGQGGKAFYKSFTKCWSGNNINKCGSKSVLDCNYNSLHHDHVHIALPFCPRKSGIASE